MRNAWLFALSITLLNGCMLAPPDAAKPTPQRPTVSSDTNTTAPDTLELEAGITVDPGDRFDSPIAVKWGASESTELFAGWSPYQRNFVDGDDPNGVGDVLLGMRHRFVDETDELPSVAMQWTTKLPTAPLQVGTGEIDFAVAAMASKTMGEFGATGFYELGVIGQPNAQDTDIRHTLALAGSATMSEDWFVFAEIAGIFEMESDLDTVLATGGAGIWLEPGVVLDFALAIGLSEDAPDLQLLIGSTQNLGTLFR